MQKCIDKTGLYVIIKSTTNKNLSKGGTDHLTSKVLPQKLTSSIKIKKW